jgi:hypothetical protein
VITGAARFVARYPRVWHVIDAEGAGAWLTAIGLLPAAALFRLAGLPMMAPTAKVSAASSWAGGEKLSLRPQLMPDARLLPTLDGIFAGDPIAWRRHINAHVFFWVEERRRDAVVRAYMRGRSTEPHRRAYLP